MNVERRYYPRTSVDWPAELRLESGESIRGSATDASPAGIQIACDGHDAARILPPGSTLILATAPRPILRLGVGGTEPAAQVEVNCRLAYLRRVAQDKYHIGLLFVQFSGDGERLLENHLES